MKKLFILFTLVFSLIACKKDPAAIIVTDVTLSEVSIAMTTGNKVQFEATVMPENAADKTITWTSSNPLVVAIDENGEAMAMSAGTASITATAGLKAASCNIAVSVPDVYSAGYERIGKYYVAKVWKNNEELYKLSAGTTNATARSVFVSGDDVYVVGDEGGKARTWKNGVLLYSSGGVGVGGAFSVVVSNGDVYVAGYEENYTTRRYKAVLWKNGEALDLTSGPLGIDAAAFSIFIDGQDIYVAGSNNLAPTVWKNGAVIFEGKIGTGEANEVVVSNGDVYVAGYKENDQEVDVATMWKNGVETSITDGTKHAYGMSIGLSGTDVYVAGYERLQPGAGSTNYHQATVWKNQVQFIRLTENTETNFAAMCISGSDVYTAGQTYNMTTYKYVAKVYRNGEVIFENPGTYNSMVYDIFLK